MSWQGVFALIPDPYGMVPKAPDGRTVFRYMIRKPAKTNLAANSACCFHPLYTPSGVRLTDLAPGDHHHRRGVFLACIQWNSGKRLISPSSVRPGQPAAGISIEPTFGAGVNTRPPRDGSSRTTGSNSSKQIPNTLSYKSVMPG